MKVLIIIYCFHGYKQLRLEEKKRKLSVNALYIFNALNGRFVKVTHDLNLLIFAQSKK